MSVPGAATSNPTFWWSTAGDHIWYPFRDVFEVDGVAVRDRDLRLAKLFLRPSIDAQARAKQIGDDSTRYNLGNLQRSINYPVFPFLFLFAENQMRLRFARTAPGGGVEAGVRAVAFTEESRPTIITGPSGQTMPAHGRFWIEETTGRVVKSEILITRVDITATLTVMYGVDKRLQMDVPLEMRETKFRGGSIKAPPRMEFPCVLGERDGELGGRFLTSPEIRRRRKRIALAARIGPILKPRNSSGYLHQTDSQGEGNTMRKGLAFGTLGFSVLLSLAVFTAEKPSEQYSKAMKDISAGLRSANEAIKAQEFENIGKSAGAIVDAFPPVKKFWTDKGDQEAVRLATGAEKAAADLRVAAGLQSMEGVEYSAKELTETCAQCHKAHHEQLGRTFQIKWVPGWF